jgi:hypothetical protein
MEPTTPFVDVSERYEDAISYLYAYGIIQGISTDRFGIQQPLKRVDAAVIIAKSIDIIESTPALEKSSFTDVPDRAMPAVSALQKAGILNGKTKTSFAPNATLTRGEAALILSKAYELPTTIKTTAFTDMSASYKDAVDRLVGFGIAKGKSSTRFSIQDPLTRGELALMLYQLENRMQKSPYDGEFPFSAEGVTLELDKKSYSESTERLKLTITNTGTSTYYFGLPFHVEKKVEGSWYRVPYDKDLSFPAVIYSLMPGESHKESISADSFELKFENGDYRLVYSFGYEDRKGITLAVPFTVNVEDENEE